MKNGLLTSASLFPSLSLTFFGLTLNPITLTLHYPVPILLIPETYVLAPLVGIVFCDYFVVLYC